MVQINIQEFMRNNAVQYEKALKYKYAIGWDFMTEGNTKCKKYSGFNTYAEMNEFLKSLKFTKKRVFYEITKSVNKPYFDFDKVGMGVVEIREFIDLFIERFNLLFKTAIGLNDLQIYYRKNTDNANVDIHDLIIQSVHISVNHYKLPRAENKLSVDYFKSIMEHKMVESMDSSIYFNNKLFSLPYNTKLEKYQADHTNPQYFEDLQYQSNKPSDYLLTHTENCSKLTIPFYNLLALRLIHADATNNKSILQTAFDKLKKHKNIKSLTKLEYDNPIDILDTLIYELPTEFYTNSKDWKCITNILNKFELPQNEFCKWNKISILKNSTYTEQDNINYWKNIKRHDKEAGNPIFKQIVEKYLPHYELIFTNGNGELLIWLLTKIEFDKSLLHNIFNNENPVIIFGDQEQYEYRRKTGYLTDKITNVKYNYFVDIEYKKLSQATELKDAVIINEIEDIAEHIDKFNQATEKTAYAIKAKWGVGKTHHIMRRIIEYANENNAGRIVVITENNALNRSILKQFNTLKNPFISHINTSVKKMNTPTSKDEDKPNLNVVCSTESIYKVKFRPTDILILDEYESIFNHYESTTFNEKSMEKFMLLKVALTTVKKIVVLDADISNERVNLLRGIIQRNINIFYITKNNFQDYTFNLLESGLHLINKMKGDIINDKRLIISSSSKNWLNGLYEDLIKSNPTKKIVKVVCEGQMNNFDNEISKSDLLNGLEEFITTNEVDIFLHSPTIKTGISINAEWFNQVYCYGVSCSVCSRELLQMLFRARNLKDKVINIALDRPISRGRPKAGMEVIKHTLINPVYLLQSFKIFESNGEQDANVDYGSIIQFDNDYFKVKFTNKFENYNSNTRYSQDLLSRLIYNHGITLTHYISPVEEPTAEEEAEEEEAPVEMRETKLITFLEHRRYEILKGDEELPNSTEEATEITYKHIQKYNLFYKTYFIKGITDKVQHNQNTIDAIDSTNLFYGVYTDKAIKDQYNMIKYLKDQSIEQYKTTTADLIVEMKAHDCKFDKIEKLKNTNVVVLKLLGELKINLNSLPLTITNAELNKIVLNWNFTEFNKYLQLYYTSQEVECKFNFDFNDKKYISNIKAVIKDLLKNVNIEIKYVSDKNTTRPSDKMKIQYTNFVNKPKLFTGRLTADDKRPTDITKTRNTYKITKTEIKVYPTTIKLYHPLEKGDPKDPDKIYYTTYQVKINKATKTLAERILTEEATDLFNPVLNELINNFTMIKPYIISNAEYEANNKRLFTEATLILFMEKIKSYFQDAVLKEFMSELADKNEDNGILTEEQEENLLETERIMVYRTRKESFYYQMRQLGFRFRWDK